MKTASKFKLFSACRFAQIIIFIHQFNLVNLVNLINFINFVNHLVVYFFIDTIR
ncbi:hypothetical protein AA313_de0210272 [Arthrobotrys entomopaga]|nr:hypothetical protein AA313_de0210272 [Arthrobotrys entomopaga]